MPFKSQIDTSLRIRLTYLAIISLFIALAAAAYFSGHQVNRDSELVAKDAVPGTIAAHKMRLAMSRSIGWVLVAASAQSAQYRDACLKTVADADAAFSEALREYKETIIINPAEDQALLEPVIRQYAKYHQHRKAYEALILAGNHEGAAAFLERDLVPAYVQAINSAEELLAYNHANSITFANHIRNSVRRLYWSVAIVIVLAIICASVLIISLSVRRREVNRLQESEELFRTTFENATAGVCLVGMDGRFLKVNRTLCDMLGYSRQELLTLTFNDVTHGEDKNVGINFLRTAISGGPKTMKTEKRYLHKDGRVVWAYLSTAVIEKSPEHGGYMVSYLQDITERKRDTEQLEMLKVSIEKHFDAAYWMDTNNQFVYVNESACKSLGYTREELLGKSVTLVAPRATPPILEEVWKHLRESGFFTRESVHRHKDGSEFPIEIVATYVRFEGKEFNCGFARNITERKQIQDEMLATNERYSRQEAALIDLTRAYALRRFSIPELKRKVAEIAAQTLAVERFSIWRYERDRQGIVCQEIFEQNGPVNSVTGTTFRAEDVPAYFRALAAGDVIAAHDACHDPRTREFAGVYLSKLGITSMLDAPIHVVGSLAGVICFEHIGPVRQWTADEQTFAIAIANVVSLLLAEEERQQIEAQFRQAQKVEAIGQLAGGVAHDFNNLLSAIIGFSEMTLAKMERNSPHYGNISQVIKAGERAAALTRQLLIFSRKQIVEPKQLDLNSLIGDLYQMLRRLVREDIDIVLALSSSASHVMADPGQIEQVITNLVVNARDAMPQGGVLTIATSNMTFDDAYCRSNPDTTPGEYVQLSITDTGLGMTDEVKARLFEPFFTTKPVGQGTGLGLATCYGAVKQSRGHIIAESTLGQGTTFRIFLPRLAAQAADPATVALAPTLLRGTETILLVEDDSSVRQLTHAILTDLGYQVLAATDGFDGLRVANEQGNQIRLLLTDVVMPLMNGKDLADSVRAQHPRIKVIFMSGYTADTIVHDGVIEPDIVLLQKPFSSFTLSQKVREILDS